MNEITINTSSGSLFCREWRTCENADEAFLLLHGVESHSGWFSEIGRELALQGHSVLAYDRPGWGKSQGQRGHLESYNDEIKRIEELANALRVHHSKVHLVGLSWGGMLALYAALRRKVLFDSVTLIAPGIIAESDLPIKDKLLAAGGIICNKPQLLLDIPINLNHFTKVPEFADYIKNDHLRNKQVSASFCFETLKMRSFIKEQASKRTLPPTLLLLAGNDQIINNTATKELLESKPEVQIVEYANKEHSLVFECPQEVVKAICENAAKSPSLSKSVVVFGAGAVGSTVGGLLALGGVQTTLVAREKHANIINNTGLTIKLGSASRIIKNNLSAVTQASEITTPPDLVILSVKSFDTPDALEQLAPVINEKTTILSLQNGVSNERMIAQKLPKNTVLGGAICAYLNFAEPGKIEWSNDRGGLAAGLFSGDDYTGMSVAQLLRASGMEVTYCNDAMQVKWSKLLLNTAFNAINAATGLSTAQILSDKKYSALSVNALREGFAVMKAQGIEPINLPGYDVRKLGLLCKAPLLIARKVLAKITAKDTNTISSMQQDLKRGRGKTEISEINGAIVSAGEKAGIQTPANRELCAMIEQQNNEDK